MKSRSQVKASQTTTERATQAAALPGPAAATTDPERRLAASGHGGIDAQDDHIRVAERHGIWTVTAAGVFIGDYHDPDAARAAAGQARNRGGGDGDVADPWQRFEEEATP